MIQEGWKSGKYNRFSWIEILQFERDKIKKKYAIKNGHYIEIDLRKIKTIEKCVEYIENKMA